MLGRIRLEEFLTNLGFDQFVPLPAWNPSTTLPGPFQNTGVPEIMNTTITIDGEVIEMDMNVIAGGELEMYDFNSNAACQIFPDIDVFAGVMRAGNFGGFNNHNEIHGAIGGAMRTVPTASASPIFWLFHAHVDELYWCFQANCQCANLIASGSFDGCNYCFDFSQSEFVDEIDDPITLIGPNGSTSVNLVDGCIPWQQLQSSTSYTAVISGFNNHANGERTDCTEDEIEVSFISTNYSKGGLHPCLRYIIHPQFPVPARTSGQGRRFTIKNNTSGPSILTIRNVNLNTGTTFISTNHNINADEEISFDLPAEYDILGMNYLIIDDGYENTYFQYLLTDSE